MENNEMSFEALYSEAIGISSNNTYSYNQSSEGFDGFYDALEVEIAKSFESLAFLDTYSALEQKNSAEMIRMCKKLSVNYGLKSGVNEKAAASIESLCRIRSMEAEETTDGDKPKEKKQGVFKKILAGLKRIFTAIGDFFIRIWEKIKQFFIIKLGKIDRDLTPEEIKAVIDNEKVWKGAPKIVVTNGKVVVEKFKIYCKDMQELAKISNISSKNIDKYMAKQEEFAIKTNTEYKQFLSIFSLKSEEYSDNIKQKVVEWAAKAENLKGAVESIKSTEQNIKDLNLICKNLNKFCEKMEDSEDNTVKGYIEYTRKFSKLMNRSREDFVLLVKAIIFAKKLYNAGKHTKDGKVEDKIRNK